MDGAGYDMEAIEIAMNEGSHEATCFKCGYTMNVEPDGDYPCPECKGGRVTSILIAYGLI